MKKLVERIFILFTISILAFVCSTNVYASVDSKEKEYLHGYTEILNAMKQELESSSKTGDVRIDFLEQMISHRQMTAFMAENIIKYGNNKDVRNIAKSILKDQTNGIIEMTAILDCIKDDPKVDNAKETEYLKKYKDIYKNMTSEMECIMISGNVDKHFLKSMIVHHEGMIKMASNGSKYINDKVIKEIAEKIQKTQDKQLKQMNKLIEKM